VVRRFPTAGVTLLLCVLLAVAAPPKSRVGSSRVIDAEPQIRCLIFQPMVGRLHSSMLCIAAAGDGEEFLPRLARWYCHHYGSPGLCPEAGGLEWCAWKLPCPAERRTWCVFRRMRKIPRSGHRRGVLGLTSAALNSPHRHRLPPSPPGVSWRSRCQKKACEVLQEVLRCSLAMSSSLPGSSCCLNPFLLLPWWE